MSLWWGLLRLVEWGVKKLTYAYVLRVPLLCSLVLILICFGTHNPVLGNLFDVQGVRPMYLLSFTAFVTAWTIMVTWRIILIFGPDRIDLAAGRAATTVKWRNIVAASLIVLPIVLVALCYPDPVWSKATFAKLSSAEFLFKFLFAALGLAAALFVLAVAEVLQKWFTEPRFTTRPPDKVAR